MSIRRFINIVEGYSYEQDERYYQRITDRYGLTSKSDEHEIMQAAYDAVNRDDLSPSDRWLKTNPHVDWYRGDVYNMDFHAGALKSALIRHLHGFPFDSDMFFPGDKKKAVRFAKIMRKMLDDEGLEWMPLEDEMLAFWGLSDQNIEGVIKDSDVDDHVLVFTKFNQ